jgi:N6-adenosine-specific RNA methylase IME4
MPRNASDHSFAAPKRAGNYDVVYADPPWIFQTYSFKGKGRGAEAYYDCMQLSDIKTLPVGAWAKRAAVLYLWCTVPHLKQGIEVLEAWGFAYKSNFVWVKERVGTGYWCRNRHEILLIAARGLNVCPRYRGISAVDSVIEGQQRAHSQKPDRARCIIEQYHPNAVRLEMFARERAVGWDSWGLEADTGIGQRRWRSNSAPERHPSTGM